MNFGADTWEEWSLAHEALLKVGGVLASCHIMGCSRVNGYEAADRSWFISSYFSDGYWDFTIAGSDEKVTARLRDMLAVLAGDGGPQGPDWVSMTIWSEHPMGGGLARYGTMRVGVWDEVMANYTAATREALESLAVKLPSREAGGIVVLGGPAGTGKTRAIEALCHAWAGEASLGVVVDSDRMLGSAAYLTDVITAAGPEHRQVIVAEDVDDMVKDGPKSHQTSKLLNIADGLVGRLAGAGTLFVLSANLPLADIASYIKRPGRAAAAIEFELFSPDEANAWLAERGVEHEVEGQMSLAEMFALTRS